MVKFCLFFYNRENIEDNAFVVLEKHFNFRYDAE